MPGRSGILGIAPVGLLLRLATRAGEVATVPVTRWAEAGAGARLVAGGLAALTVAGSGVGIETTIEDRSHDREPQPTPKRRAPPATLESFRTPARLLPRLSPPAPTTRTVAPERRAAVKARANATKPSGASRTTAGTAPRAPRPQGSAPAHAEFSFERGSAPAAPRAPAPTPAAPPDPSPSATEFSGP